MLRVKSYVSPRKIINTLPSTEDEYTTGALGKIFSDGNIKKKIFKQTM